MAKRRRRSGSSSKNPNTPKLPKAAEIVGFTEADEAFFRAGEAAAEGHHEETQHQEDEQSERPGFWRRLFTSAA
jgi:hypothetical protein